MRVQRTRTVTKQLRAVNNTRGLYTVTRPVTLSGLKMMQMYANILDSLATEN